MLLVSLSSSPPSRCSFNVSSFGSAGFVVSLRGLFRAVSNVGGEEGGVAEGIGFSDESMDGSEDCAQAVEVPEDGDLTLK